MGSQKHKHKLKNSVLICVLSFLCALPSTVYGVETCSRTANINFSEVLVDNNSTQKGEGLRFHLEKDAVAKKYLDEYQAGLQNKKINAFLGTTGSLLIFSGLLVNESKDRKRTLLIGGASIMLINFLVAKTIEYKNESNLRRAIDEYNKRNLPRINFGLTVNDSCSDGGFAGLVSGGLISFVDTF